MGDTWGNVKMGRINTLTRRRVFAAWLQKERLQKLQDTILDARASAVARAAAAAPVIHVLCYVVYGAGQN